VRPVAPPIEPGETSHRWLPPQGSGRRRQHDAPASPAGRSRRADASR